jgi:DNA-binding transcriptional LysR family regulator
VLDRLEHRMALRAGLEIGRLRLGVVTTAKYLIPAWLGSYCRQHPGIEPELQVGNRAEIIGRLQQNLDDLYVFSHPPMNEAIEAEPITENPLVVIAPKDHPLVGVAHLEWGNLAPYRLLMREEGSGTRYAIERHFERHGLQLHKHITVASNEAIKEAVVAGLGLAVISRHALRHLAPDNWVELPVATFPIPNNWYLVTLRGKHLSPVAQSFRAFVRHQCAQAGQGV